MMYKFLTFQLDVEQRELRENGTPVSIPPKAFDVLCYLVAHQGRMVPKSELMDKFWSANVSEAALQKTVSLARKALAKHGHDHPIIKTYHGQGFRFSPPVQERLPLSDPAGTDDLTQPVGLRQQRLVAVLCVTISPSDNDRATPVSAIETFLDTAREVVQSYQGNLMRMTLDGFTADFGLHHHLEDGSRRAVHCAVALAEAATGGNSRRPDIKILCSVDTGSIDVIEGDAEAKWTPPSEVERGATQLAESAYSGQIVLSEDTQKQLRGEVQTRPLSNGHLLVRLQKMGSGIPGRPLKRQIQFVGRMAEMAFLSKLIETLQTGSGEAILLSGPAGIGKTRLISEFLSSIDQVEYRQLKLQCLPALSNSPLAPIRELCLALLANAVPSTLTDEIDIALLKELQDDARATAPILANLSDHQRRQKSCSLLNRVLQSVCDDHPFVIVFEDVHWMDATSRDFLDAIIQDIGGKRLFIVMTTRPVDDLALTETVLQLSPLSHMDSLKLLVESFHQELVDEALAETLVRRAAGNPFFIEELALAAQSGGDPATELPDTVQAVIAVRIGGLAPELQSLLHVMAVIGPPAPLEIVQHLLGLDVGTIEPALERLVRMGFVQVGATGYSFRHMLINDTAYAMVATRERIRLHGAIAAYLESDASEQVPRPEKLAWHHQESGNTDSAISNWKAASRAALHRLAHLEAIAFAQNGLALIDAETRDSKRRELELLLCLAPALTALRGFGADDVGAAYGRARDLSTAVGNTKTEIRVLVGLWIHTWVRGRLTDALKHARKLLDIANQVKDPALSLQAHASMGQVLVHKGDLTNALVHLKAGMASIGQDPPVTLPAQNATVACISYAAWANGLMGLENETYAFLEMSLETSTVFDNPFAEAIHYALSSEPFMFLGDVESCLSCANHAVAVSREHDFVFWLGTGLVMRGWALGQLGEFEAAFEAIDEGISAFEGAGACVQLANWYGLKAETLLAAGKLNDGLEAAKHALVCAERTDDLFFAPRIHATMARLYEKRGDFEHAAEHQKSATDMAEKFRMTNDLVRKSARV